nr:MAG TPA: hypothetical protein [Caudoviricetes sp.]
MFYARTKRVLFLYGISFCVQNTILYKKVQFVPFCTKIVQCLNL